jgi:hypothetical protein
VEAGPLSRSRSAVVPCDVSKAMRSTRASSASAAAAAAAAALPSVKLTWCHPTGLLT